MPRKGRKFSKTVPTPAAELRVKELVELLHICDAGHSGQGDGHVVDLTADPSTPPIMTSDGEISTPAPQPDEGDEVKRIFIEQTTMDPNIVLEKFWAKSRNVESAITLSEMKNVNHGEMETVAQVHRGGTTADVELCEENRIDIQALHRDMCDRLIGKFLLCRTVTLAINGMWLEVVIDDPTGGHAAVFRLSNFTPPRYSSDAGMGGGDNNAILGALPPGSFIIVKHPYAAPRLPVKLVMQVTCQNPSDIVLLTPKRMKELFPDLVWNGPIPHSSIWDVVLAGKTDTEILQALKRKGNEAFVLRRYTDSIRCYDLALDYAVGNGDGDEIWSNKAAAFLGLGCFQKGLECCEKVLSPDPNHLKGISRKVNSLIGLGRQGEAVDFLNEKLSSESPLVGNKDLINLRTKIIITHAGKTLTLQDFRSIAFFRDFCSDYVGPVEYRPDPLTGRGYFATEDLKPGDLVLAHKTYAEVEKQPILSPTESGLAREFTHIELIGLIANKIAFAPEVGPELYKLWAGEELKNLKSDDPESMKVNVERIQEIVALHTRYGSGPGDCGTSAEISTKMSQVNQSCSDANVLNIHDKNRSNLMAIKPIKAGEEILFQFVEALDSMNRRKTNLIKLGMSCNCRLCQRDSEEPPFQKQQLVTLMTQLRAFTSRDYELSFKRVKAALGIVHQLQGLRKNDPQDLNTFMVDASFVELCDALFQRGLFKEYITFCKKSFLVAETLNIPDFALGTAKALINACVQLEMHTEAIDWVKQGMRYAKIVYGTPDSRCAWPDQLLDRMKAGGINVDKLFAEEH